MAAGRLLVPGWSRALDSDGDPISARISLFLTGTDDLAPVYSNEALTIPITNPVESNSAGRFPAIWADDAVTYDWSVEAPYGPPGSPFTGIGLTTALAADVLVAEAAETAADSAEIAAAQTASDLAAIQAIEADGSTAPAIAGKLDRDASNIGIYAASFRSNAGLVGSVALAAGAGAGQVGYLDAATDAVAVTIAARGANVLYAKDFGVVGDGTANDQARLQAAVNAAVASRRVLELPALQSIRCNSPITVATGFLMIRGAGDNTTEIIFPASDGFVLSAGARFVTFANLSIAGAPYYSGGGTGITPNAYTGILCNGTNANPINNVYTHNVNINGFQYAVKGTYVSSSRFHGITTLFSYGAIWLYGRSVNNTIHGCNFTGVNSTEYAAAAGSTAVRMGDGTGPQPEGCIATDNIIFGFKRAARNHGCINFQFRNNLCDAIGEQGVLDQPSDGVPTYDSAYTGNWFGMVGAADSAYFHVSTETAYPANDRDIEWKDNKVFIYSGTTVPSTLSRNINVSGAFTNRIIIDGNGLAAGDTGAADPYAITRDLAIDGGRNHRVTNNAFNATSGCEIVPATFWSNNTGRVAIGSDKLFHTEGTSRIGFGTAAPASGTYAVGDKTINLTPSVDVSSMVLSHWLCTVAGSPGTHVAQYFSTVSPAT